MQQRQFTQRPMGQPGMMGVPGQMYQHPAMGRGIMIGTDADNKGLLRNAVMNNRKWVFVVFNVVFHSLTLFAF